VGDRSPRDRYLTIYGRMPVLEALRSAAPASAAPPAAAPSSGVRVAKVFLSQRAGGAAVEEILAAADAADVVVERVREEMVAAVARNGRHHQGVAADLVAAGLEPLADFLERRHGRTHDTSLLMLDGVHNPANAGMIIRTAVAAGLDGVVVPRRGTAELGPLVIKASAGVALSAPLLRCATASEAAELLVEARFHLVGLDATRADADSLFAADLPGRAAYVLGNEAEGISPAVADLVERWVRIPLAGGVESLNVSSAATLVAFEVSRRRNREQSRRSAAADHPEGAVSDAETD
jgi:23S rRNA (guanosine2251-2'-O)-methyltransferase